MASIDIPGYNIYEKLGHGGMATVYRALHVNRVREVALKVIDTGPITDPSFSERFLREARTAAGLSHPHIQKIYDVDAHGGLDYIAMELMRGGDLKALIRGAMTSRTIRQVMQQMTEALDYAADQGCVHGNIKPGNIMRRGPDDFALTDFGIARAAESSPQVTRSSPLVGTPSYMSPEQAEGAVLDGRSDLYSLAVVCYEMLTGQVPYAADTAVATALKHLTEDVPRLPGDLAAYQPFFDRGLAKRPQDRFQSGREMYQALAGALGRSRDNDAPAPPAPTPEDPSPAADAEPEAPQPALWAHDDLVSGIRGERRATTPRRRRRRSGAGKVLVTLLALAGAAGGYYYWQQNGLGLVTGDPGRARDTPPAHEMQAAGKPRQQAATEQPRRTGAQDLEPLLAAGGKLLAAGDYAAAGEQFAAAAKLAPDSEVARDGLEDAVDGLAKSARTAARADEFDRADTELALALTLMPNREDLVRQRAGLPALREARALAQRVEEGRRLLAQDAFAAAAEQFRKVLDQAPDTAAAQQGLEASAAGILADARAEAREHRYDSAREKLAAALAWLPGNAEAAALEAELPALEQAWKEEQAAIARRRAEANRRANATVQAITAGDLGAARRHYSALSSDYPEMEVTRKVRQRLLAAYTAAVREEIEVQSYDSAQALIDEGQVLAPELAVWAQLREEVDILEANDRRRLGAY